MIPKYGQRLAEPKIEPTPEPMQVEETIDPTQTRIDHFKDLLKKRLKIGE